jgi:hypothetical protein
MPRLLDSLSPVYTWLAAIDPSLPRALFVALVFLTVLAWRKLSPGSWKAFSNLIPVSEEDTSWFKATMLKVWQALPSAILGAVYGGLGTGGNVLASLKLAALALLAPVVHEVAWRYQGNLGTKKNPGGPTGEKPVGLAGGAVSMTPKELFDDTTPPSLPGAAMRGGTIQKVEAVISSNVNPSKIAQAVIEHLKKAGPGPHAALALPCLCAALFQPGCASWKTVVKTADTAAELACAEFFGAKQKLSIEEAAKAFCSTREDLEPWIEAVLAAKREAGPKAAARHP